MVSEITGVKNSASVSLLHICVSVRACVLFSDNETDMNRGRACVCVYVFVPALKRRESSLRQPAHLLSHL